MPYYSGSFNDMAGLRSALVNACTANGWSASGEFLSKGAAVLQLVAGLTDLTLRGGTGRDGDALVEPAPGAGRIGTLGPQPVTFPGSYEVYVFTSPDEVYLRINYNVEFWQWLAFGISDVPGVPGSGLWFGGTMALTAASNISINAAGGGATTASPGHTSAAMFHGSDDVNLAAQHKTSFVHHGFDELGWSGAAPQNSQINNASIVAALAPKLARLPNAWNSADVLLNTQVYVRRPDDKQTLVADLSHARFLRIDNYQPGDIIQIGPDRWKVAPWYRKNTAALDGGSIQHTGTFGWAIRYEGP